MKMVSKFDWTQAYTILSHNCYDKSDCECIRSRSTRIEVVDAFLLAEISCK